jgi:2-oxoisovalerate dehydrogenase E1 component alpha subunit
VLIEGMTYRLGHHSTSDDSSRYRGVQEVAHFKHDMDPLTRLQNFLKKHGLLSSADIDQISEEERFAVLKAMEKAEKRPKPPIDKLFDDVYNDLPQSLRTQKEALVKHIEKYPKKYSI